MKYPIGIQTFDKIIDGGYVYVDKTDLIYQLVQGNIYFLGCRIISPNGKLNMKLPRPVMTWGCVFKKYFELLMRKRVLVPSCSLMNTTSRFWT